MRIARATGAPLGEAGVDLTRRIYGYCERAQSDAFWAEPWNAITNSGFILAAILCFVMAARARRMDGPVVWLITLTFAVGIGSFLFHTFATRWAALMDTLPIMLFILSYFAIAMRCYAGFGWGKSLVLMLGAVAAMIGASIVLNLILRDIIGGSVSYLPAMLALLCIGAWLQRQRHPAGRWLMAIAGIFTVSLTFRALDFLVCDGFPTGTHFLWHLLNGVVLGSLVAVLIRHGRRVDERVVFD